MHLRLVLTVFVIFFFSACVIQGRAGETPPLSQPDQQREAARISARVAADWLRQIVLPEEEEAVDPSEMAEEEPAEDEEQDANKNKPRRMLPDEVLEKTGLFVLPHIISYRKITGYEETGTKKVKVKQIKRTKIGEKEMYKWVRDPNDPYKKIYRKVKVPIYKTEVVGEKMVDRPWRKGPIYGEGKEKWFYPRGMEGQNALALLALFKTGHAPLHPVINKARLWMQRHAAFTLPDATSDLALLTMCFMYAGQDAEPLVLRGLRRLLLGQIRDGEAKGLWGHYCYAADYLEKLKAEEKRLESLKTKRNEEEIREQMDRISRELPLVTRELRIGHPWNHTFTISDEENRVHVFPIALYNARLTRIGNLIDTQLALMALAEAERTGFLDLLIETADLKDSRSRRRRRRRPRRDPNALEAQLPKPPHPAQACRLAIEALTKLQGEDGLWALVRPRTEEKDLYPQVTAEFKKRDKKRMDWAKKRKLVDRIKAYDVEPRSPKALASAAALHAFAAAALILDPDEFEDQAEKSVNAAAPPFGAIVNAYLDSADTVPVDAHTYAPASFWLGMQTSVQRFGEQLGVEDFRRRFLLRLLAAQNEDGSFGTPLTPEQDDRLRPYFTFPYDIQKLWERLLLTNHGKHTGGYGQLLRASPHHQRVGTSIALLCYARLLAVDVAALWDLSERGAESAEFDPLGDCLEVLQTRVNTPMRIRRIEAPDLPGLIRQTGVLILRGTNGDRDMLERLGSSLVDFAKNGGTLISVTEQSGFHTELLQQLTKGLPDASVEEISFKAPAFNAVEKLVRKRDTYGLYRNDRLVAYFWGWDPKRRMTKSALRKTDPIVVTNIVAHVNALGSGAPTEAVLGPKTWEDVHAAFEALRERTGTAPPPPEPEPAPPADEAEGAPLDKPQKETPQEDAADAADPEEGEKAPDEPEEEEEPERPRRGRGRGL